MQYSQELECLMKWWQTPMGQPLLQAELKQLEKYLHSLFGYKLLLLAPNCFESLSSSSRMGEVLRIDPGEGISKKLPLNVDAIVIPHLFSYFSDLDDLIRDLYGILESNGQLIITGYQSLSYLGWYRFWHPSFQKKVPPVKHSKMEIKNLLQKNLFHLTKQDTFAPISLSTSKIGSRLFSNAYILSARKDRVSAKISEPITWKEKRKMPVQIATGCQREQK